MNLPAWLLAQVFIFAFIFLVSTVYSRAYGRANAAKTIVDLQRNSLVLIVVYGGVLLLDVLLLAWVGVLVGGLSGWVMVAAAVIAGAWVIWNWPAKRRLIIVDAETDIAGDPFEVSAFFADVCDWGRWAPEVISIVEAGMSLQGPRFHQVCIIPTTTRRIEGDQVLKVNQPGKEVVVGVEGGGLSADQFVLSPTGTGTHVLYREVLELPFFLALAAGKLLTRDKDRRPRHIDELARAKAVFEAAHRAVT